jgi:hypothetical protein
MILLSCSILKPRLSYKCFILSDRHSNQDCVVTKDRHSVLFVQH